MILQRANIPHYLALMRADKPIGTYLLLWPTLWALWLAADGVPSLTNLIVFCLGTFVMRSAGCVINDYADRDFDKHVKRTEARPLTSGLVTPREALALFGVLVGLAVILVLFTHPMTWWLAPGALVIASIYPFMKRYTHLPQVVLGAAFSWSIPMAYAAQAQQLPPEMWYLYVANLLWVVAYDTYYAMVDRDDDLRIGIRSTAILFGSFDKAVIAVLQLSFLGLMFYIGQLTNLNWPFHVSLVIAFILFCQQWYATRTKARDRCFKAFLDNHYVGMVIFGGIALGV
jgi:4-hydroxybenzoate polyprenyltransferase